MKKYFWVLKTTLLYKNLINNYHFIVILLVLLGLVYYHYSIILFIILILYIVYLIIKNHFLAFFALFILGLFITGLIINEISFKNAILGEKWAYIKVLEIEELSNSQKLVVKVNNDKYLVYSKEKYEIGDILYIKGIFSRIDKNHIQELFNYQEYCKYQQIIGQINISDTVYIGNEFTISKINNWFNNYYDNNFSKLSSSYLKALVIGNKNYLEDQVLNNINSLGISHLFVVSGLHISMLISIVSKLLNKITKKNNIILTIILLAYMFITNMLISVIRVVGCFILKNINTKYQLNLSTLDILSIVTILVLIINPYYLFQSSFILSFGLTYALIIGSKLINDNNKIIGLLKMSVYCQLISIPLSYNFSNKLNILSVIFNYFFVPFVSYIFLPVSLIVSFCPFLNNIYEILINIFLSLIKLASKISFYINIPNVSIVFLLIYFVIIYLFFKLLEEKKKKRFLVLIMIIYISIWLNSSRFDIYDQIIFFDLPKGESTLIHSAFNKYNILIDTGDIEANNSITDYLKKRGIRKLDYVFITHSDSDHIGGLEDIMKNIKVDNLVTNIYEQKSIFNKYRNYNKRLNIFYLKQGDKFKYHDAYIECILPKNNLGDVNNNSLVFTLTIDAFTILFTGDIEEKAEKQLDKKITCNLLKVAHHGSLTSTSSYFLSLVEYDKAIIINGYRNQFGFPASNTLKKLKDYYITSYEKTIIYQKLFYKKDYSCFTFQKKYLLV